MFGTRFLRSRALLGRRYSLQKQLIGEDNVVNTPFGDVDVEQKPSFERVFEFAAKWPNLVAVECGETGRRYTYSDLQRRSRHVAASLLTRLGVRRGQVVAVILPNCPEFPAITLGAMMAGTPAALINPAYTANELKHHFSVAEPKAVFTSLETYAAISSTLDLMKLKVPVVVIDAETPAGAVKYSEISDAPDIDLDCLNKVDVEWEDIAILPFSSGTTGLPKAVALPHKALTSSSYICSNPVYNVSQPATESSQDVIHAVLPFYHIYGHVSVMLNTLAHGTKLVTLARFSPELYLKVLNEHRSTLMFAVPPLIQFVAKHPLVKAEYLEQTRQAICGGAFLPPVEFEAFESKHKKTELMQAYGLTETTALGCATARGTRKERNIHTSGQVFSNMAMKVMDMESQKNLGPNEVGELWVRGPAVMSGYYGNPEQTKNCLYEGEWFRTGDVGYYDEKGYFYITERLKDLIKVKGFQVTPAELEGILLSHPAVHDVGVVGVPTKDETSEQPVAFVVLQPGVKIEMEELNQFVSEKVTAYKRLGMINVVDAIPKTNTGKILRRELRRIFEENFSK